MYKSLYYNNMLVECLPFNPFHFVPNFLFFFSLSLSSPRVKSNWMSGENGNPNSVKWRVLLFFRDRQYRKKNKKPLMPNLALAQEKC